MKKFLLFLTLFLSAVGLASAAEKSYTFTGYSNTTLKAGTDETTWSTSKAPQQVDSSNRGIQWAKSSGTFTISSSVSFSNVTKVSLVVASTAQSSIDKIEVGGTDIVGTQTKTFTTSGTNTTTLEFSASAKPSGTITITIIGGSRALFVKTITITTEDGTSGGGTDLKDPEITWTLNETAIDEDYAVSATLDSDSNVFPTLSFAEGATVTCTSSNESVATVANNGTVTIKAAGTTTITASTSADDATFKQASKSYSLTVIDPNDLNATIDFSKENYDNQTEMKDQSVSIGSVSASFSKGSGSTTPKYFTSGTAVRMYAGNTLTFTAPGNHYITKIEFTGSTGSDYGFNNLKLANNQEGTYTSASDKKSGEWVCGTSEPTSVQFAAYANVTNGKVYIKTITVHYAALSNKEDAGLAYTDTKVTKLVGADKFTNPLTNDNGLTVTYASDNAEVATVDANSGEVTILAAGTVTITATFAGNETYKAGSASYALTVVDKFDAGLAYTPTEVTLVEGETLTQPAFNNPNELTVSYDSTNKAVATVDSDGTIHLAGGLGTAVITATSAETETYKAGSATFTITVKESQIAYLVTDASVLKVGDIIIIANQDEAMAISTEEKTDNRPATAITFNSDKSEIVSIGSNVMLFELKVYTDSQNNDYWMLATTNYTGTAGSLNCGTGTGSSLKIGKPNSNYYDAVITIDQKTGEANIAFNKGASEGTNIMRYNSTSDLFNCYAATNSQKPVYIYRVTDKPATVDAEVSGSSFRAKVNDKDNNVVEMETMFLTSTSYNKVAIYMENVLVGTYAVNSTSGEVNATFDHVPYLPTAKFTMRPVLNTDSEGNPTQVGPAETLNFDWADINSYAVKNLTKELVWIDSDAKPLPATATLGANTYFDIDIPTGSNLNYYVEVVAKNLTTDEVYTGEFSWCDGGFCYSVNPYITDVPVDTENKSLNFSKYLENEGTFPTIEYSIQPIYKFDVAEQYRSLLTPAAPRPARVASTITDGVQTVVCDAKSLQSTFSATTAVSGVEGVTVDGGAAVEYFNLQGVRVDGDLAPGIYIRRQGQTVSKIQIR